MIFYKYCSAIALGTTLLATATWFAALETSHPRFFSQNDGATYFSPAYFYNWQSLIKSHTIPLINFNQHLGQTWLALGQPGTLYFPAYLATAISLLLFHSHLYTLDIFALMHWLIGSIAMYILLRRLKIPLALSTIGSITWITFPYFSTITALWPTENFLIAYLPLNFLLFEKLINTTTMKSAIVLGIMKAWFLLTGYPQHTFIIASIEFLLVGLLIYRLINNARARQALNLFSVFTLSLLIAFLLSAPILLPMFEAKISSYDRSSPLPMPEFIKNAVHLKDFVNAQLFQYQSNIFWETKSHILHISIFSLALTFLLLIKQVRKKAEKFNTTRFALVAVVVYLTSTSLHSYFYNIPIFNWFRGPIKYFPFLLFFLTLTNVCIAASITQHHHKLGRIAIYSLLILSVFLNINVAWSNKETGQSLPTYELQEPLQPTVLQYLSPSHGRVFSFETSFAPKQAHQYILFNFATFYNVNHFSGYFDPLLSAYNQQLTSKLNWDGQDLNLPDQKMLDLLSRWSVRYLVTSSTPLHQQHLNQFDQLNLLYSDKQVLLYENTIALPYVYESSNSEQELPHEFLINQLNIFPTNPSSHQIIANITPLPRYIVYADNVKLGRVVPNNGPILINVPANTKKVSVKYQDPLFLYGSGLCISTILVFILLSCSKFIDARQIKHRLTISFLANNKQ